MSNIQASMFSQFQTLWLEMTGQDVKNYETQFFITKRSWLIINLIIQDHFECGSSHLYTQHDQNMGLFFSNFYQFFNFLPICSHGFCQFPRFFPCLKQTWPADLDASIHCKKISRSGSGLNSAADKNVTLVSWLVVANTPHKSPCWVLEML